MSKIKGHLLIDGNVEAKKISIVGTTSGSVSFIVPLVAGSEVYELPSVDGNPGESLITNGSGVLSWGIPTNPGGNIAASGRVTLVSGVVDVLTPHVHPTSRIFLTPSGQELQGNGKMHYDTVVDGVSFRIHTGTGTGNTDVDWMIIN